MAACVPQQKYLDLEQEKNKLQNEVTELDSIANSREYVENDLVEMESELAQAYREIEGLRSTNIGLNRSYQELLARYSGLVNQNSDIVNASGDRQFNLQQELSMQRQELIEKENQLNQTERDLQVREERVRYLENAYSKDVASRDQRILELQNEIFRRDQKLNQLRINVDADLGDYNLQGLSVTQRDGKLYVSLSQDLLFSSGSSYLGSKGRQALQSLVKVLNQNSGFDVNIEGHTDNQGTSDSNWRLSIDRSYAVAKAMINYGLSQERIAVSGRGQFQPVTANTTESGRAQNRRTEIVLIPRDNNLNRLLYRQ